jgi:hypothetical protein
MTRPSNAFRDSARRLIGNRRGVQRRNEARIRHQENVIPDLFIGVVLNSKGVTHKPMLARFHGNKNLTHKIKIAFHRPQPSVIVGPEYYAGMSAQ